jgi:hypothetical protein
MNTTGGFVFKPFHSFRGVPLKLAGTDRVLQRWAVSIGDGSSDMSWHEFARSQIPVLSDQVAIVVDQLICRSPGDVRQILELWYRRGQNPTVDIARKLHCRQSFVVYRWQLSLEYMRARFLESPLSELRGMAAMDPSSGAVDLSRDEPVYSSGVASLLAKTGTSEVP